MLKPSIVYGIYHGSTLGYVGLTTNLERRKIKHLNPHNREIRLVDKWLQSVNYNVDFVVLETLTANTVNAEGFEKLWREKLRPKVMA